MQDLESLRNEVRTLANQIDENTRRIPQHLKSALQSKWDKCVGVTDSGIKIAFQEGKGIDDFTDNDLLKAIYASPLTYELLQYRELLSRFLAEENVTETEAKALKRDTNRDNTPEWWPRVESQINSSTDLTGEDKESLLRFALDNDWTGCTKGVGRKNDFFVSSVVNASNSNVTHNAILGSVSKDLLHFSDETEAIKEWYEANGTAPDLDYSFSNDSTGDSLKKIILAITAKPFGILTGTSGTGKTKLAEALAEHFRNSEEIEEATNFAIVPVGADWTDNRNVLGFVNHLRDDGSAEKRPIYQSTPVLDLLIEANRHPSVPYFLILDEMNLSHVERYFADFLSTMEQIEGKLLLHDEGPREDLDYTLPRFEGDEIGVPRELPYPQNLFVIGTVNIDETTYMFSPKVLDRANVIEFTVDESDIAEFLQEPSPYPEIEKAADGMAEAFLGLAVKARNDKPEGGLEALPSAVKESVNEHILNLFKILKAGRFEFAFRSSNEVLRYLKVCRHLSEDKAAWDQEGWRNDLDDQILQKLLPKLHGSLGRIGKLLAELADYCTKGELRKEDEPAPKLKAVSDLDPQNAAFPKSLKKLQSMVATLLDEQFVSFIH